MYLDADGIIVLLVTPDEPHASLAISPEWADSSNLLLYSAGCTSFTTAPEETWEEAPGEATEVDSVVIPNLVGAQNSRVTSILMSAGIYASWRREYVQGNPSSACKSQLEGTVVWQNMEPGSNQVLSGANQLIVQIDCPY